MNHNFKECSLIHHVSNGSLNFENLVKELSDKGYLLETEVDFGRASFNAAKNEDFNRLFEFFYPKTINNIDFRTIATDKGTTPGTSTYAFYNSNIMPLEEILDILCEFNKQIPVDLS